MKSGYIMFKDTPVVRIKDNRVDSILSPLCPPYFNNFSSFEEWILSRTIDTHRTNSRILRKMLRLKNPSSLDIALKSKCRTVTDKFWFKEEGCNLDYKDVLNLDDSLYNVALLGNFDTLEINTDILTPELTNIGSFEKCWKLHKDNTWYLLKKANAYEMFSEIFISRLCKYIGFPSVQYDRYCDGVVGCENFVSEGYWFEHMFSFVRDDEDYQLNYNKLLELKPSLVHDYLNILFMDALIQNPDRHTFNYGVIYSDSGVPICMAPNYDNNLALVSRGIIPNKCSRNNPLISDFIDLVKTNGVSYKVPELSRVDLNIIINSIDTRFSLEFKNKVVDFIMNNYNILKDNIRL